jgi:hypothetical protein
MLHIGLGGPEALIYWNNGTLPVDADQAFEDTLDELNRVVGCRGRQTRVEALADWSAPWLVTGAEVGGAVIWRFTPDDPAVVLSRDGTSLVARVGARRLTFPHAWAVPSGDGFDRGVWVMQAAGAAAPSDR